MDGGLGCSEEFHSSPLSLGTLLWMGALETGAHLCQFRAKTKQETLRLQQK